MLDTRRTLIAPRTCRACLARAPSKRALWEATIIDVLAGSVEPDEARPPAAAVAGRGSTAAPASSSALVQAAFSAATDTAAPGAHTQPEGDTKTRG
jgi:hypothetical protein